MNIAIGSDHAGYELKTFLIEKLSSENIQFTDFGTNSPESVDYPDFAHPVAEAVETNKADFGIVICGSGNGVSMAANKHAGIRCALCWTEELAELAKLHNNANVLGLPARFIDLELALSITRKFLSTDFEGGRHQQRVSKI